MTNNFADLTRQKLRLLDHDMVELASTISHDKDVIEDITARIDMLTLERDLMQKQVTNKQTLLTGFTSRKARLEEQLAPQELGLLGDSSSTPTSTAALDMIQEQIQAGLASIKDELEGKLARQLDSVRAAIGDLIPGSSKSPDLVPTQPFIGTADEIAGPPLPLEEDEDSSTDLRNKF